MTAYDFGKIEEKWKKIYGEKKLYEPEIDTDREKVLITVPVIYPTGSLHLGHLYTWTRADIYARFMRMRGYNVLFPQGFHMTGGPLVGLSLRLKNGEQKAVEMMKNQGVSDKDIKKFSEDPVAMGLHFSKTYQEEFTKAGISIDWRRVFTLSHTPQFSRFVEWQFDKLRENGFIVQGTHPVIWCPNEDTPLGDHDRLSGEGESPVQFSVVKFKTGDYILPAGTLRPETLFGVTNIWVNRSLKYKEVGLGNGEKWVVSAEFARRMGFLVNDVKSEEDFDINSILGEKAVNPATGENVPIFDADFVSGDAMTGIVMSVPMHAPLDYVYLKKEKIAEKLESAPKTIIDVEGEKNLVDSAVKKFGGSADGLKEATKYVYKRELASGTMNTECGDFSGMTVGAAREKMVEKLGESHSYASMYEPSGEVVCRCGAKGVVKLLENQWFIHYSDKELKDRTLRAAEKMDVYPDDVRTQLMTSIANLEDKAAARHGGLGTPLPWDKDWLIEPLSDSTIYMAYYTIAAVANRMKTEDLGDRVFDYVFLGKKDEKFKYPEEAEEMRREFSYWYPVDMRITARELLTNHILFFIANHAALFPPDKWPKGLSINGWLAVNKQKMGKSKGNAFGISESVEKYGVDPIRLIGTASDGMDDAEWDTNNINAVYQKMDTLRELVEISADFGGQKKTVDAYVLSRLNRLIKDSEEAYGHMKFRTAVQGTLFEGTRLLKEYTELGGDNAETVRTVLSTVVRLNHPIFPFVTEELNEALGGKTLLEKTKSWPEYDAESVDETVENEIEVVTNTKEDIRNLARLLKITPKKITIGIPAKDSFDLYNKIVEEARATRDVNAIRKKLKSSSKMVDRLLKNPKKLPEKTLDIGMENRVFEETADYLSKTFGCAVKIEKDTKEEKAMPGKPAIKIE